MKQAEQTKKMIEHPGAKAAREIWEKHEFNITEMQVLLNTKIVQSRNKTQAYRKAARRSAHAHRKLQHAYESLAAAQDKISPLYVAKNRLREKAVSGVHNISKEKALKAVDEMSHARVAHNLVLELEQKKLTLLEQINAKADQKMEKVRMHTTNLTHREEEVKEAKMKAEQRQEEAERRVEEVMTELRAHLAARAQAASDDVTRVEGDMAGLKHGVIDSEKRVKAARERWRKSVLKTGHREEELQRAKDKLQQAARKVSS